MENLLRYRAWDKIRKKMGVVISNNWMTGVANIIIDNKETLRQKQDYILMQSTGLKDKNDVEIFEGDIIATNSFACIVSFGKYDYFEADGIKITGIGFYLGYLNVEPATYSPFETPFLESCEVLGNIYENELDLIMYEKWKSENWN